MISFVITSVPCLRSTRILTHRIGRFATNLYLISNERSSVGPQLFDPQYVDHDRQLAPPKKTVKPYPKRVTEDDVRNNPPSVHTSPYLAL